MHRCSNNNDMTAPLSANLGHHSSHWSSSWSPLDKLRSLIFYTCTATSRLCQLSVRNIPAPWCSAGRSQRHAHNSAGRGSPDVKGCTSPLLSLSAVARGLSSGSTIAAAPPSTFSLLQHCCVVLSIFTGFRLHNYHYETLHRMPHSTPRNIPQTSCSAYHRLSKVCTMLLMWLETTSIGCGQSTTARITSSDQQVHSFTQTTPRHAGISHHNNHNVMVCIDMHMPGYVHAARRRSSSSSTNTNTSTFIPHIQALTRPIPSYAAESPWRL